MKKSFAVSLHVGFWLCYWLLIIIILAVYNRSLGGEIDHAPRIINALKNLALFAILPSVICYFSYCFFLFPRYLQQKKYFLSVVFSLAIAITTATIFYFLHRYFIEHGYVIDMDAGGRNGRSTAIRVILVTTFIGGICGIIALVIQGFITWFQEIKLKEALREKNYEMEMALIKSQLDPHLLFNTINNIDALILKDAVRASEYLNKLSDIMRFILYETKADRIALSRELEYIAKYIDLQKIRTANKSYVNYTVTGNADDKQIVPMAFISFIENAFKHTTNKKVENAITVTILIEEKTTRLLCENKFDPHFKSDTKDGGLGNELIQKRLNLTYGENHKLEVRKTNDIYQVSLTLIHE
ncbi:sensor histidine kinase [Adhaeribacter aquaticus]|uniref:sensor histidine kinase n=1 Tax=Adhaeribacter aquaticus TaxID=299567 RepID=UPI00047B25B4|nr:sensor histidine kinase [Adhaeribacter aquaticus]